MALLGRVLLAVGDVEDLSFPAILGKLEHLHLEQVDHRIEAGTGIHGVLAYGQVAEQSLHLGDGLVEVGVVVFQVVDGEHHGRVVLEGVHPGDLGTHFHAVGGVDHDHGGVGHGKGGDHLADEIVETGGIDDVDLLAVELGMQHRGEDRVLALQLDGPVVGYSVLVIHASSPVDLATFEQHAFGQGGLAGFRSTDECDILDLVRLINLHFILSIN